jgi:glycosyltransferase involved in cell wall biosynthesis
VLKRALKFAHLQLWRRLPHAMRRAALFRLAALWAPRITPDAGAKAPVIVVGMLRHASGLGAAARACHDALKDAGLPVYGIDLTTRLLHEENHPEFDFRDGRDLLGDGTVLLHVSGPLVPLAMVYLGRSFVRRKRIIAHWFWELPHVSKDWLAAVPFVHEVWVNTRFVAEAIRPIANGRSVEVVPYPLAVADMARPPRDPDRRFTVLVIFNIASSVARKNPCAAISAFRRAFGDDPSTRLIVKYLNAFAWPEGLRLMEKAAEGAANIELHGEVLNAAGMDALYEEADVVMSLHRAEGLGLVVAEAMLRHLPAIATDWSGNVDFLTSRTGMPLSYTLVPVDDPQGNYGGEGMHWAEVDLDAATTALRKLRDEPDLRQKLGDAAASHAAEFFHPRRYVRHVVEKIDGLSPLPQESN